MSPGEVSTLYWFQPDVPSVVYGVDVVRALPHPGRYARSAPLVSRTSTSLQRSPFRSPNGTTVIEAGQPEADVFVENFPAPSPRWKESAPWG